MLQREYHSISRARGGGWVKDANIPWYIQDDGKKFSQYFGFTAREPKCKSDAYVICNEMQFMLSDL
jgi:hypothetical protein